ncbi:MAG: DNA repair protein RadA [Actinobacteria bacterium]|nr:DNA repair protein RadA [Actinomycetota bacterium]
MSYRCEVCAYRSPKWMGFCPQCRSDGALVEEPASSRSRASTRGAASGAAVVSIAEVGDGAEVRRPVGIGEVDRVLGGGLVEGAVVLVGGEPGVGKSTLLLQAAGVLAAGGGTALVATAEESAGQVGIRARRLGVADERVLLAAERDVDAIIEAARATRPALLVVDSIQTVGVAEVGGAPGGVAQVRESAARLIHFAKESGTPVVLVGHITKDGGIAGPKLLEHAVDVVLYLEGDVERGLRMLRCLKNRFGATHQVGLFEMRDAGLTEVPDPSEWLLARWKGGVPGSVVFPAVDGRRPLLVEVQALVADATTPQPRRSVQGLEAARVHQLLAVLERHAGLRVAGKDVYVGVVGGIRLREPGSDLPVALAVASSLLDRPTGPLAAWGEVGLTGEIRAVAHHERRAEEVARLGIGQAVAPSGNGGDRIEQALGRAGLLPG